MTTPIGGTGLRNNYLDPSERPTLLAPEKHVEPSAYSALLLSVVVIAVAIGASRSSSAASDSRSAKGSHYHFRLVKGTGTSVCDAFLRRLQMTTFRSPPYCGIPESNAVKGFGLLKREYLSREQMSVLWPRVFGFMRFSRQMDDVPGWPRAELDGRVGLNTFAWRYNPPVSLENDGSADRVVVWHGYGADDFQGTAKCGEETMVGTQTVQYRASQVGFILTTDDEHIDETRTRAFFGHPYGRSTESKSIGTSSAGFGPLGLSEEIVEFDGLYYVATFYDALNGDFSGSRVNDPELQNTLALLLRRNGATTQVCEYEMSAARR